ncbi:Crp/Fnr family transcriptional regulator [Actinomadura darangshiensis]|uniref:Crp/Fnr family transcriptional regulator n=1 Tax=Actinomadura darangshiensis TaxID=705336 RepID=A0A4R5BZ66_9ACTN|nr:Crp/Fnr family transcriptional regulator [Actinomadura darangshiensis]TDD92531.1 Crp/Fnr family transcriptional regulator [Actinomadura darangshiensis]
MEITRFWDALGPRAREALLRAGVPVVIRPGAFLMREHTRASQVFVLRSGAVKVWVDRDGESAILDVLGPGDVVGELEAVDGGTRHANVEALTRVEAVVLPAARFRGVLDAHPGSVWAVAAVLAERLRDSNELRVAHFPDDPERRLAGRLLRLVARFGSPAKEERPDGVTEEGVHVRLPVSQHDLGRWAGMGRRKVAQILASEPVRGGLTVARSAIVVRSVDVLHRLARDDDPALEPGGRNPAGPAPDRYLTYALDDE